MNSKREGAWLSELLITMVCASGCSHGPPRIDCERQLVPINTPAATTPSNSGDRQPQEGKK